MTYEDTSSVRNAETYAPVVVGLFGNSEDAHRAVTQLRESGFTSNQIGAAFRHRSGGSSYVHGENKQGERESWWEKLKDAFRPVRAVEHHRQTSERAGTNVGTEDTFLPPDGSSPSDDYEYDFTASEIEGSLADTGIPQDRAAYLTDNLSPGGAIVTVRDPARAQEAENILSVNDGRIRYEGAPEISLTANNFTRDDDAADRRPVGSSLPKGDRVQLFGEVLRVHKERIRRGEVRLRKDVVMENQTVEVPVTHEELVLERVAVPKDTPAPSANIGESTEVRIPLSGESIRVDKQSVVREEVVVGKREVTKVETMGDNVRREELRIDNDAADKRSPVEDQPGNLRPPA